MMDEYSSKHVQHLMENKIYHRNVCILFVYIYILQDYGRCIQLQITFRLYLLLMMFSLNDAAPNM